MINLAASHPATAKWTAKLLRSESTLAAAILIIILNIVFFPCVWGNKTMLESARLWPSIMPTGAWAEKTEPITWGKTADGAAAAWFFEPSLAVTAHDYWTGTLPLWNPYQGYGQPFAADMQAQPFFPLTILIASHVTERTYDLYLLTRLLIAGFFTYLFLRLFVDFLPALAGGIAMMLGGYSILEIVMPHLSVEMLSPAALFTGERLLRRRSYGSAVAFAIVLFLMNLGGMPESALLALALVYCYLAFRIVVEFDFRESLAAAGQIALASVAGLGLSCVVLLPFLEFLRHGYNTHDLVGTGGAIPGLFSHEFGANIFNYLFPLIYGPYHELSNEFGIVVFFLILISLFGLFTKAKQTQTGTRLRSLTFFFLLALTLLAMKRYGMHPVSEIGRLPLFRLVDMYKYDEALITLSAAMLCGVGAHRLLRSELPKAVIAVAFVIAFAMIPLAAYVGQAAILDEVKGHHLPPVPVKFPEIALGLAAISLFALAISVFVFEKRPMWLGAALAVLLTTELALNFIPAVYYIDAHLPSDVRNPYQGAPYIKFLQQHTPKYERVFARDSILYPDWASVFQLGDIRDLDAMYFRRYLPFIRNFIQPGPFVRASELWDRFTGADLPYDFSTELQRRLLQLSSVKYLLTTAPYAAGPFQLIYDHEVKVYEFSDVLPRAALFHRAEIAQDAGEVLKRLSDPNFNIFDTVLLEPSQAARGAVAKLGQGTSKPVEAAEIVSYRPQRIEIHAAPTADAILVLNDSAYPGWTATVDGESAPLVTANFLFRGVMLKPGRHVIRFAYRPKPFYLGATIAGMTMVGLCIPTLHRFRRRGTGNAVAVAPRAAPTRV